MVYKKENNKTATLHGEPMGKNILRKKTEQPTIASWLDKQSVIYMARQTHPGKQIHLQTDTRMQQIMKKWAQTWGKVKQQISQPKNTKK